MVSVSRLIGKVIDSVMILSWLGTVDCDDMRLMLRGKLRLGDFLYVEFRLLLVFNIIDVIQGFDRGTELYRAIGAWLLRLYYTLLILLTLAVLLINQLVNMCLFNYWYLYGIMLLVLCNLVLFFNNAILSLDYVVWGGWWLVGRVVGIEVVLNDRLDDVIVLMQLLN